MFHSFDDTVVVGGDDLPGTMRRGPGLHQLT